MTIFRRKTLEQIRAENEELRRKNQVLAEERQLSRENRELKRELLHNKFGRASDVVGEVAGSLKRVAEGVTPLQQEMKRAYSPRNRKKARAMRKMLIG